MNTLKVILATLVIFSAGVITGAFAVRLALVTPPPQGAQAGPATQGPRLVVPNTPFNRPDFLERMTREVGLRAEQRERVEQILRDSHKRTEPFVREFTPKVRAEVQLVREHMLQVLDPEQRIRFDELMRARPNQQPRTGGRIPAGQTAPPSSDPAQRPAGPGK